MKALIVADGDFTSLDLLDPGLLEPDADGPAVVIAADGGALKAERVGLTPALVVGDADSLSPEAIALLHGRGIEVRVHPTDKDESDTELCVREAVRRGATSIVIVGALGGLRFDHAVANLLLLTLPELSELDAVLADESTTVRVVGGIAPDRLEVRGRPTDLISLMPLSEVVDGVRTEGLAFALAGEALHQGPSRGLSNVMQTTRATVSIEAGRLAVIHSRPLAGEATDA